METHKQNTDLSIQFHDCQLLNQTPTVLIMNSSHFSGFSFEHVNIIWCLHSSKLNIFGLWLNTRHLLTSSWPSGETDQHFSAFSHQKKEKNSWQVDKLTVKTLFMKQNDLIIPCKTDSKSQIVGVVADFCVSYPFCPVHRSEQVWVN